MKLPIFGAESKNFSPVTIRNPPFPGGPARTVDRARRMQSRDDA